MKSGFLSNQKSSSSKAKPEKAPPTDKAKPQSRELDEEMLDTLVIVFQKTLDNRGRQDLENRVRQGSGAKDVTGTLSQGCCGGGPDENHDHDHDHDHDHGHGHSGHDSDDSDEGKDIAGKLLLKYTSAHELRKMIPVVLDSAGSTFNRVKKSGEKDGMAMTPDVQEEVQKDVLKETLIREIIKRINAEVSGEANRTCNDGLLLATPQGFQGELDTFSPDHIRRLMTDGYVVLDNVMNDDGASAKEVYSTLEHWDFEGKFQNVMMQMMHKIRSDKRLFFHADDILGAKQKGFSKVMKLMISVPFELNKKCGMLLQVSTMFEATLFNVDAYHKKWFESGFDGNDIGRKITVVYFTSAGWGEKDKGHRRVYKRKRKDDPENEEVVDDIAPIADRLYVFRSREMAQEVLGTKKKLYELALHSPGPAGPGDDMDEKPKPS